MTLSISLKRDIKTANRQGIAPGKEIIMQNSKEHPVFDGSEYSRLKAHMGHELVVASYGDQNVSIGCINCCEVLHSVENLTRLERIQEAVSNEFEEYKRIICSLSVGYVFSEAYHINLVNEVAYAISNYADELEEDEEVQIVLEALSFDRKILSTFLNWADDNYHVNVSNAEQTLQTLRNFCGDWLETQKGGGDV